MNVAVEGAAVVTAVIVTATAGPASATPIRDNALWSVLLCEFSDRPAEPPPPSFFADLTTFAGPGTGGVADYFVDRCGGRTDPSPG